MLTQGSARGRCSAAGLDQPEGEMGGKISIGEYGEWVFGGL